MGKSLHAVLTRISTERSDSEMNSFSDVIDAFGGPSKFAAAIGRPPSHARTMRARNSIPAGRWLRVVDAARECGVAGISLELLARLEAGRADQ